MFSAPPIKVINRQTGREEIEAVYGEWGLALLYGDGPFNWLMQKTLTKLLTHNSFFSHFYGWLQSRRRSRKKVVPFIEKYGVDAKEFLKPPEAFTSFNDFFTRRLKPDGRPLADTDVIIPADGRYWVAPQIDQAEGFLVKGKHYCLETLFQDQQLANKFSKGTMVMARLCPSDYHRFHFPCAGTCDQTRSIKGKLCSVNPIAVQKWLSIFTENKRSVSLLETENLGTIAIIEVGATCVGTIHQTYTPYVPVAKGEEKGFFSFGGSATILLFEPNRVELSPDLVTNSERYLETLCLMGQPLATRIG